MSLIQPYSKDWVEDFGLIRQELLVVLSGLNISIEHVGSTAVEGLAAKPIIDIDLAFDSDVNLEDITIRLAKLGYIHVGDQGIKDREVFKRAGKSNPVLDTIHHHLYACPSHSEELAKHIKFRDHLRDHPEARLVYERLKFLIAEEANHDRKLYATIKEMRAKEFIENIISEK